MAGATGLEPATSSVTGRRSNQLSYAPSQYDESVGSINKISSYANFFHFSLKYL